MRAVVLVLVLLRADASRTDGFACVRACSEVYFTKRMQRVSGVLWSADARYVLSASDETNIRLWRAHAADKPGTVRSCTCTLHTRARTRTRAHCPLLPCRSCCSSARALDDCTVH